MNLTDEKADVFPGALQIGPERLTLDRQFRLVEIAHETTDPAVKAAALSLLELALNPPQTVCQRSVSPDAWRKIYRG